MALLKALTSFLVFSNAGNFCVNGQGCSWNVHRDLPKGEDPLLFVYTGKGLTYAVPERSGEIQLGRNQDLVLSCPGELNYIGANGQQSSVAKCGYNQILVLEGGEFGLQNLSCAKRAVPALSNTGRPCAKGKGVWVEIGYTANAIGWQKLVESCRDVEGSFTYYSRHALYGTAIRHRVSEHGRPRFNSGGSVFYRGFNPNKVYAQKHQKALLESLVGPQNLDQFFDPARELFMARGHLAPSGDFLFSTWQTASFFYLNAAPQWQTINGGNWRRVEQRSRQFAEQKSVDLEVVTGTYGVMKLLNEEVYLAGRGRLPVPELFWKILRNPSENSCIAFVSTNDPFLKSPPRHICPNICRNYGWPVEYSDLRKGYVYCCDYRSINAAIGHLPDMKCNSVLTYN